MHGCVNQFVQPLFFYLPDDRNLIVVANGVFAQEIEFHHTLVAIQLLVECNVFHT